MVRLLNLATMRNRQVKFYSPLIKSDLNIHVIFFTYLAVVQLLANSLSKVDIDLRMNLYNEVVLSGGNTMFEGFPERFIKEMKRILPSEVKSRIMAPPRRDTMCWEGGSILAQLTSFKSMWTTKADYMESGRDHLVNKKAL